MDYYDQITLSQRKIPTVLAGGGGEEEGAFTHVSSGIPSPSEQRCSLPLLFILHVQVFVNLKFYFNF